MERLKVVRSEETELARFLHSRVVGQEDGVAAIVGQWDKVLAGMADPSRPVSTMLFLGPTGVGKTKLVEAFCEYLYGDGAEPVKVNCGEYTHDHQVARLIGSPAGYVGHGQETVFSRRSIEERRTKDGKQLQVVLFDEIEKAGSAEGGSGGGALRNLMLAILDRGVLGLSNGQNVNFKNTIIFMTSNLGAKELLGAKDEAERKRLAEAAARAHFSPEQFNRLDEMVVFKPLSQEQIQLIADLEVTEVAMRAKMELELDDKVRDGLAKVGYDPRYGARHLRRMVDKYLTRPLASMMASGQLAKGSRVRVEVEGENTLAFFRLEGQAAIEEKVERPVPVVPAPVVEHRQTGYVKRMLDRQFQSWNQSHGAKIFRKWKELGFKPITAEQMHDLLVKEGFTCNNAQGTQYAITYVMNDWMKKQWAVRSSSAYGNVYTLKD